MHGIARLPIWTAWVAVLLAAAVVAPAQAAPIATRQTAFQIPFHIDPPRDESHRAIEVQLYVSSDRGASWRPHSRVAPEQKHFTFRAEQDGEYWFLVRTKDVAGRILPDKAATPELQVVVDTTLPKLEVNAERGPAGEIVVRWTTSDPHLEPQNLKIDFQSAGAADLWQSVALDPRRVQASGDRCSGETIVWPKQSGEALTIRAEILDRAGNRAVAQTQIAAAGSVAPSTPGALASTTNSALASEVKPASPPSGGGPLSNFGWQAASSPSPLASPPPPFDHYRPATPSSAAPTTDLSTAQPAATRWPADMATTTPLTRSTTEPSAATPMSAMPYIVQRLPSAKQEPPAASPPSYTPPPRGQLISSGAAGAASTTGGSGDATSAAIEPPLAEVRRDGPGTTTATSTAVQDVPLSGAERPRMVNSSTFQIDYDVSAAGTAGVRKVELWGTRDGGLHWQSYGVDADNISPLTATVEGEGTYGFRILVQSAGGMVEFPPKSGDRPEIWLGVDLTRPTCRLTRAEQGQGERASAIDIYWEAWDRTPAERPITLSYSDQPTGPWLPIAASLLNNGHYVWQFDNRVPERVYLRLEMRDLAGNVETTQTTQPLMLDFVRPKGRIREVRPSFESTQGPKTYRFF